MSYLPNNESRKWKIINTDLLVCTLRGMVFAYELKKGPILKQLPHIDPLLDSYEVPSLKNGGMTYPDRRFLKGPGPKCCP